MDSNQFEAQQREREYFHNLKLPPGSWPVIRVDGRSFTKFTQDAGYQKPFDYGFHQLMMAASHSLMEELNGIYAFTESDEISVLLPPDFDLFRRSWEKIVSISASIATASFASATGDHVNFDSRIWLGTTEDDVVDYFSWRQADAARCALNGWCYWTLRKEGLSGAAAEGRLRGISVADKNELLHERGINFNDLPLWQRRGTGLYWEMVEKEGYNPKLKQKVKVMRRKLKRDDELPRGDEYRELVKALAWDRVH